MVTESKNAFTESVWEGTFRAEHTLDGKIRLIPDSNGRIRAGGGTMNNTVPPIAMKTELVTVKKVAEDTEDKS